MAIEKVINIIPSVSAQETDDKKFEDTLREKCKLEPENVLLFVKLQECEARANSQSTSTTETCAQELSDFMQAIDQCVAKTLSSFK